VAIVKGVRSATKKRLAPFSWRKPLKPKEEEMNKNQNPNPPRPPP
jgi:hypothetical protein